MEEFKIASSTDDWDLIFITIWHTVALYQWLWDCGEKNHERTFQQMLSAWPPLALSFSMEIHFLPGCHPFIFSHPSSNWGFHLISTVYSSYEVKSWETFESVDPDDELQLINHSAEAKDSSSFSTDKNLKKRKPNPKNVKYLASIPLRFYYIPLSLQLTATGSAAESAGATEAKFRKTRIKCSSWWELLGGAPRALEHTLLLLGGSFAQHPHLSCTFWWIHGPQLLQSLHGKKVTGTMKKDEGM